MADTDNQQPSVSNTMGAIIIGLLVALGGVIVYQNSQLNTAMNMLNLLAADMQAEKDKK